MSKTVKKHYGVFYRIRPMDILVNIQKLIGDQNFRYTRSLIFVLLRSLFLSHVEDCEKAPWSCSMLESCEQSLRCFLPIIPSDYSNRTTS